MNISISSSTGETATSEPTISAVAPISATAVYQAPAIESVVTFDNLQREVFYAGGPVTLNVPIP